MQFPSEFSGIDAPDLAPKCSPQSWGMFLEATSRITSNHKVRLSCGRGDKTLAGESSAIIHFNDIYMLLFSFVSMKFLFSNIHIWLLS